MTCSERVSQWTETVSRQLPHLSCPQANVLALWSLGMVLARSCRLWSGERVARVAAGSIGRDAAATLAGMVLSRPRQSGQEASHVGGGSLFCSIAAALVLAWWPEEHQELALALDATTLGQRFTVLCISVLVRGCAIAVAWKVLAYNQKGSWQPYWQTLLAHLDGVIPAEWTVLVLADRGLYAPWLYRQIVAQGWHPRLAHQCRSQSLPAGQRSVGMDQPLAARFRTAVGSTGGLFCRQADPPGLHEAFVPRTGVRGGLGRGHRPASAADPRGVVSLTRLDRRRV